MANISELDYLKLEKALWRRRIFWEEKEEEKYEKRKMAISLTIVLLIVLDPVS